MKLDQVAGTIPQPAVRGEQHRQSQRGARQRQPDPVQRRRGAALERARALLGRENRLPDSYLRKARTSRAIELATRRPHRQAAGAGADRRGGVPLG